MCFWIHLQLDGSKLIDKLLISDDRHHFDQFGHYTAVKETIIEMPWLMVLPSICFKCLIKFISAKEGNTFPIARFSLILEKLGNTFPIACFSLILEKSENTKNSRGIKHFRCTGITWPYSIQFLRKESPFYFSFIWVWRGLNSFLHPNCLWWKGGVWGKKYPDFVKWTFFRKKGVAIRCLLWQVAHNFWKDF